MSGRIFFFIQVTRGRVGVSWQFLPSFGKGFAEVEFAVWQLASSEGPKKGDPAT